MRIPHRMCLMVPLITVVFYVYRIDGRLTHNGLPTGQTVVPTGREYLVNAPLRSPTLPRGKKARQGIRPMRYITPSTNHPFLTLRDSTCVNATPLAIRDDSGWVGVVRSVSAKQLSGMMTASAQNSIGGRDITIILFHGGVECEWSRQFWPVWAEFSRRMRRVCVVAIDGANDSMMNYNLMVLGFPTVMRVTAERSSDTFRGNRTVDELVEWAVGLGGGPPMETDGWGGMTGDIRWLEVEEKEIGEGIAVLDVGETGVDRLRDLNWALIAANVVSVVNVGYILWKAGLGWMRGKSEDDVIAVNSDDMDEQGDDRAHVDVE